MTTPCTSAARRLSALDGLLLLLFLLGAARLAVFAREIATRSLQLDFSAYYTAGQSANRGLSPYVNHAAEDPALWDGAASFRHSRFLYPPLVATLFRPVAWLPYALAKTLWNVLSLALLVVSLALATRPLGLGRTLVLVGAVFVALYFPLLAHLDRGQMDLVTLLLVMLGVERLTRPGSQAETTAGAWLALAALFKPHAVLLVPFLALRRRWRAILGYAGCGLLLLVVSLALDGPAAIRDYATEQLPRAAAYGEAGPAEWKLPGEAWEGLRRDLPAGRTRKGGRVYAPAAFSFQTNASLVRSSVLPLRVWIRHRTTGSLLVFAVLFALTWGLRRPDRLAATSPADEIGFWQLAMACVLLASPLTWVMSAVWLLPAVFVLLALGRQALSAGGTVGVALAGLGLIVLALPDVSQFPLLLPPAVRPEWLDDQYVLGTLLVFAGLLLLPRAGRR